MIKILVSAAFGAFVITSFAGAVSWTGGSTTDATAWGDAANWNPGVPDETSDVTINTSLFASSKVIRLGANRQVKSMKLTNGTGLLFDGEGQYSLTIRSDINAGSSPSFFKCDLIATNAVTLKCDSWNKRFRPLGKIIGTDLKTGTSQNSATDILGDVSLTGQYLITEYGTTFGPSAASYTMPDGTVLSEFGGTLSAASEVVVDNYKQPIGYSNGIHIQNQYAVNGNRIADTIPFRYTGVGGTMVFYGNSAAPTSETIGTVKLDGAPLTISYNNVSDANPGTLVFNTFERTGTGWLFLAQPQNSKNRYLRINGIANDGHGMIGSWAMSADNGSPYFLTADSSDAVGGVRVRTLAASEHLTLAASGNADTAPSIMGDEALTLSEDADIWALTLNRSGTQTLALADRKLSIGSGGLIFCGSGTKQISVTTGELNFGGEQIVIANRNTGCTNLISAPISWIRPAGSLKQYPDLMAYVRNGGDNGAGLILNGEDRIGDYGDLYVDSASDKSKTVLEFSGPSDRRFHGKVNGKFLIVKSGSGSLELLGTVGSLQTSSSISVQEGRLCVGMKGFSASVSVASGAELVSLDSGTLSVQPTVAAGGILGGVGKLPGLGGNGGDKTRKLAGGVIIRPGLDGMPGYLYNEGDFGPNGNFTLDIAVTETSNSLFQVKHNYLAKTSKVTVSLCDPSKGLAKIKPERKITVFKITDQWTGDNVDWNNIAIELANGSPKYLDLSNAVIDKNFTGKKITLSISGLKSIPPRGIYLLIR